MKLLCSSKGILVVARVLLFCFVGHSERGLPCGCQGVLVSCYGAECMKCPKFHTLFFPPLNKCIIWVFEVHFLVYCWNFLDYLYYKTT